MRLVLLGVRGSTPAPGAQFLRYGGHTSAVAVLGDADDVPSLILDAGTGLRELPALLDGRAFQGCVVLSHLHWDHVQGLPFCPSLDHPKASVDLVVPGPWGGGGSAEAARSLLAGGMSPPHFPIGPEGLLGAWRFVPAAEGVLRLDGPAPGAAAPVVTLAQVRHKGGATLGIRVELDGASLAYLPDHALADPLEVGSATQALVDGVDLLVHDAQFLEHERALALAYGHSTIDDALRLADHCGVGRLLLTHHGPQRTDDELDALAAVVTSTPQGRPVSFARQADVLTVSPASPVQLGAGYGSRPTAP